MSKGTSSAHAISTSRPTAAPSPSTAPAELLLLTVEDIPAAVQAHLIALDAHVETPVRWFADLKLIEQFGQAVADEELRRLEADLAAKGTTLAAFFAQSDDYPSEAAFRAWIRHEATGEGSNYHRVGYCSFYRAGHWETDTPPRGWHYMTRVERQRLTKYRETRGKAEAVAAGGALDQQILAFISDHDEGVSQSAILKTVKGTNATKVERLQALLSEGRITEQGAGRQHKYSAPTPF